MTREMQLILQEVNVDEKKTSVTKTNIFFNRRYMKTNVSKAAV